VTHPPISALKSRSFYVTGTVNLLLKAYSIGLLILVTMALTRALGPAGYGQYAFIIALVAILSLPTQFGLPDLVVRETARSVAEKTPATLRALWRWSHLFIACNSIVVVSLAFAVLTLLGAPYFDTRVTLIAALALIPLMALANLRSAAVRGLGHDVLGQVPENVMRPTAFGIALLMVVLLPGVQLTTTTAIAAQLLAAFAAFLFGTVILLRVAPVAARSPMAAGQAHPASHRKWLMPTVVLGATSSLILVNNSVDVLMLGLWRTESEIGLYKLAATISGVITVGLQTMNMYAMSHISRLHRLGDTAKLTRVISQAARMAFGLGLAAFVLIIGTGDVLIPVLFGPGFGAAYPILTVLAIGQLCNAFFGPVGTVLSMAGHEKTVLYTVGAGAVFNIALNILLIPEMGGPGAAIATAVTITATKATLFVLARRHVGVTSWPL